MIVTNKIDSTYGHRAVDGRTTTKLLSYPGEREGAGVIYDYFEELGHRKRWLGDSTTNEIDRQEIGMYGAKPERSSRGSRESSQRNKVLTEKVY